MNYTHDDENSFNENNSYFDKELTEVQTVEVETSPLVMSANSMTPRSRGCGGIVILLTVFIIGIGIGGGAGLIYHKKTSNPPLATINGDVITTLDFQHRLELATGRDVLAAMIDEALQAQLAKRERVMPNETDVRMKYEEALKDPEFLDNMKKAHQSPEDAKGNIRINLIQQALVTKGVTVTDEEVVNYYNSNINPSNPQARFFKPEMVRISAIISDNPDDIKNALHDLASGVSFPDVASRYSRDRSKSNGGMLPPIKRLPAGQAQMQGLESVIFKLKPGEQIDGLKVNNMIWIIRCMEHTPEEVTPFYQVESKCRLGALLLKGAASNGEALKARYETFRRSSKIEILRPEFKDALNPKPQQ